jgi:hypothetical protein
VEGVVIVGSILLAFGIQAAWEARQEGRQETEYLSALLGDIGGGLALLPGVKA